MVDTAGRRFGRLVAVQELERTSRDGTRFWTCYCDCGACTVASMGALVRGETLSCGCNRVLGRRYGWLTVKDLIRGKAVCRCQCGNEITLEKDQLGIRESCGCGLGQQAAIDGQVSFFPAENALAWE